MLILGILLLVMSIFLTIAVLMQSGKSKRLSGTIAGGAETFFGKAKGRTIDSLLSKITTVVAILFVLVVIIVYVAFGSTYTEPEIIYTPVEDNAETPVETPEATEETENAEGAEVTDTVEGTESAEGAEVTETTEESTQTPNTTETTEGETTVE